MKALSDIIFALKICSSPVDVTTTCHVCPYNKDSGLKTTCVDVCMRDTYNFLERFTWVGKHIWIVVYDPENELCMIEENVINEVGVHHFWFSEFPPPTADIGNVMLISDIGKTVFFEKEAAEKVLKLLIERGKSNEF